MVRFDGPVEALVDGDGRIVVVGSSAEPGGATRDVAVWRLTPSGALDTAFDADGVAVLRGLASSGDAPRDDEGRAVTLDARGRILIAGTARPADASTQPAMTAFVARLLPSGARDASLGDGGVVREGSAPGQGASYVAADPTGGILVGGFRVVGRSRAALFRLRP